MQNLARSVSSALSLGRIDTRKKMASRNHIFFGIAELLNPDRIIDVQMRLMREFSITQKIVNACHAGNLDVARQQRDILMSDRASYANGPAPNALNAVFLPAIALLESKEGDYPEALSCLIASLDMLRSHRRAGLHDAGIGYIDQSLNCVRVLAMLDEAAALEREVISFIKLLATDHCDALAPLTLRAHADDASAILNQFADLAIAKAFQNLSRAALARVFTAIGTADDYLDDAIPLAKASAIYGNLLNNGSDNLSIEESDLALLHLAPLSILRALDQALANDGIGSTLHRAA